MKKVAIFLLILVFLFAPKKTFAHFLLTDGTIGAVLHIDPDDDPIAGGQASFFFDFKDKSNKFTLNQCTCQFTLLENGKEITSQPLISVPNTTTTANASFTFPKQDIYKVKVTGQPLAKGEFAPFTLTYALRVTRTISTLPPTENFFSKHLVQIVGIGFIALFLIFASIKQSIIYRSKKK